MTDQPEPRPDPGPEQPAEAPHPPGALRRNRMLLVLVFAIGVLPMAGSWMLFNHYASSSDFSTRNQGQLVTPTAAWADFDASGAVFPGGRDEGPTWKLVLVNPGACGTGCAEALDTLRAMHLLLTKDAQRVRRVYVTTPDGLAAAEQALGGEYPRLQYAAVPENRLGDLGARVAAVPGVLLVDPLGNIALSYTMDQVGNPLQKDLKHLLRTSRIG